MYYLLIFFGAAITATIFFMLVVMAIVSHKKNVDSRNMVGKHYVEIESEEKLQETIRINKIIISGDLFGDNSVEFDPIISSQTR